MPKFARLDRERGAYMLQDTYTFWKETDPWPIYEQPHRELFGAIDASMPDMTYGRTAPLSTMILAPRFTHKSYGSTKAIARMVLKYPNISIGIFRSTKDAAREQLSVVKSILTQNEAVLRYFGDLSKGAAKWDEDQIVSSTRTVARADPTVFTMGVGGTATGKHPDLVFGDDLVTEVNCDSIKEQESLWAYIEAFEPLMPPWGATLLTGTRWSEIDCYGKVEALNLASMKAGLEPPWKTYVKQAYEEKPDGEVALYYPAYLTMERLADLRSKVDPRKYNAWMFNRMVDPSEKPFKTEHVHVFNGSYKFDYPYKRTITLLDPQYGGEVVKLYVVMIVDPALTDDATSSCGYGMTVIGFDRMRKWFTLESRQRILLPSRAEEIIKEMLLKYRPNRIVIESAGGDAGLIAAIGAFIEKEHLDCIVQSFSALQHEKRGQRAKHQRIRAMERFVTNDDCYFRNADDPAQANEYGGYCDDLLRQIDAWPSLVSNDAIDSWAMGRYALPFVPTEETAYQFVEERTNPPEWDVSWTDGQGNRHGVSAEVAMKMAMGPPAGVDPRAWVRQMETGDPGQGYRPGSRTADYLRRRRSAG